MSTYEVELKRTSYVVVTVEATSFAEAEDLAWREVENMNANADGTWDIESIEELT
jgi:hypothetical protein